VDRTSYLVSEPIGVTVTNSSGSNFYAVTSRSACTFLQLQQWNGAHKQWTNVYGCGDTSQTQVLLVRAGMQEPFSLAPTSPANVNAWATGSYRIAMTYSTSTDGISGAQTALSPSFTIA
jgi:hypothetical protein